MLPDSYLGFVRCLASFSRFLGFEMEGFEEKILDLENKMKARRQTEKGTMQFKDKTGVARAGSGGRICSKGDL